MKILTSIKYILNNNKMKDGLIQFSHCNKKSNLNYIFSYASVYNPRLGNIYETIQIKYKS